MNEKCWTPFQRFYFRQNWCSGVMEIISLSDRERIDNTLSCEKPWNEDGLTIPPTLTVRPWLSHYRSSQMNVADDCHARDVFAKLQRSNKTLHKQWKSVQMISSCRTTAKRRGEKDLSTATNACEFAAVELLSVNLRVIRRLLNIVNLIYGRQRWNTST